MDTQQTHRGYDHAGTVPGSYWKLFVSGAVIAISGWVLILLFIAAVSWLLS